MKKLLIMRFSAMGDVAMTVPVIHSLATQHPELRITVVTRSRFTPMYHWMPSNVEVKSVDLNNYKGIGGLNKLYNELKERKYDAVADLHNVLRTKYLRYRFRLSGARVATIDKGRSEKKGYMGKGSTGEKLKPMVERYSEVFRKLGFSITLDYKRAFSPQEEGISQLRSIVGEKAKGTKWIGVAPFAAHDSKVYPLEKMHEVVKMLQAKNYKVFLFGAGEKEKSILESWESENIISTCGKLGGLHNEMVLMSKLDLMIAMDSANMHIAAIVGTPTLSIWGATHPNVGFTGWGQTEDNIIQLDLQCRPCSVYGNKPCAFGDLRCLNGISSDMICERAIFLIER